MLHALSSLGTHQTCQLCTHLAYENITNSANSNGYTCLKVVLTVVSLSDMYVVLVP